MDRPVVSDFAERIYAMMEPVTREDPSLDWSMLSYIGAIGETFKPIDDGAAGGDDGEPPYYRIMHPDTCPPLALPWLAQFVGIRFTENMSEQQQRDAIRNKENFTRGSPAAMRSSLQAWLIGSKTVTLRERHPTPYSLMVVLRSTDVTAEDIANPNLHLWPAIYSQKPAGIKAALQILSGNDYQQLFLDHATYQVVFTTFTTYTGMLNDVPGT